MMDSVHVNATQNVDIDFSLGRLAEMFDIESDLPPVKLLFTLVNDFSILTARK